MLRAGSAYRGHASGLPPKVLTVTELGELGRAPVEGPDLDASAPSAMEGKAFGWDPRAPGCPGGTQCRVGETYLPQSTLLVCVQDGGAIFQMVVKPKASLLIPP